MTTTTHIAYFRIIAPSTGSARDAYDDLTISDPSWDTMHAARHDIADAHDVDPMRVDLYNVKSPRGEYLGGFDCHDGCDGCRWDQSRY